MKKRKILNGACIVFEKVTMVIGGVFVAVGSMIEGTTDYIREQKRT